MQGGHTCVAAGEKKSDPEEKKKKERNNRRSRTDRCYIQLLLSHFLDALGDIFVSYQRWLKKNKTRFTFGAQWLQPWKKHFIFEGIQSYEKSNEENWVRKSSS